MSDGRVYRPSAPVNVSREMGEYYNREAARVMGYRFERPSSNGLVIRKPTPEERKARDTAIDALREARGERVARAAAMNSEAYFAAARVRAVAALARCARLRKRGSGKRKGGEG
jgi:hypothetical protein